MKVSPKFPLVGLLAAACAVLSGCQTPEFQPPAPRPAGGDPTTVAMPGMEQWETPLTLQGTPKTNPTATVQLEVTLVNLSGPGTGGVESKVLTPAEVEPFLRGITAEPGSKITRLAPSATRDEKEWVMESQKSVSYPLPDGGEAQMPLGQVVRVLPSCQADGRIEILGRLVAVEIDRTEVIEGRRYPVPKTALLQAKLTCRDGGAMFFSGADGAGGRQGMLIQVSKR
jgi:hypothetical protein